MKLSIFAIFVLISTLSFSQSSGQAITDQELDSILCPAGYKAVGQPYLKFEFTGKNGNMSNEDVKGKIVFINFWFEGCQPCMAEMEALNELYKKMKSNKNIAFISVTWESPEVIKRVKEKYSLDFEIYSATGADCQRLNFGCGYPTSIILDRTGIVIKRHSTGPVSKADANEFVTKTFLPEIQSLL